MYWFYFSIFVDAMVKQAQRYYDESALYAILFDLDSIDSDLDEIEALLDAAGV